MPTPRHRPPRSQGLVLWVVRAFPFALILLILLLQNVASVTIVEEGDGYKITFTHGSGGRGFGREATNPFYCGGNVVGWKVGTFNSDFTAIVKVEGTAFSQYTIDSAIVDWGVGGTIRNTTEGPFNVGQHFNDTHLIQERFVYENTGLFERSWSVRVSSTGSDEVVLNQTLFSRGGKDLVLIKEDNCIDEYEATLSPTASPAPSISPAPSMAISGAACDNGVVGVVGFLILCGCHLLHQFR